MLHRILALPNDPKGTITIYKAVIPRERVHRYDHDSTDRAGVTHPTAAA